MLMMTTLMAVVVMIMMQTILMTMLMMMMVVVVMMVVVQSLLRNARATMQIPTLALACFSLSQDHQHEIMSKHDESNHSDDEASGSVKFLPAM